MKKISDYIQALDKDMVARAQKYLLGDNIKSVKLMTDEMDPNEFEAFIYEGGDVLLPGIEVDENLNVLNIHCQCGKEDGLCVHKAALMLAAHCMIDTNCVDYHMARKLQTATVLENIFFPS